MWAHLKPLWPQVGPIKLPHEIDGLEQDSTAYIDELVQEWRNSIANALELRLSCTNPSKCSTWIYLPYVQVFHTYTIHIFLMN